MGSLNNPLVAISIFDYLLKLSGVVQMVELDSFPISPLNNDTNRIVTAPIGGRKTADYVLGDNT